MHINDQDEFGSTELFEAVSDENIAEAIRLLTLGRSPNIPENNGTTPLMEAASGGNFMFVQLLLSHGADPHRLDNFGDNAFQYARAQNHDTLSRFLGQDISPSEMANAIGKYVHNRELLSKEFQERLAERCKPKEMDFFSAMKSKERHLITLTEGEAWEALKSYWAYSPKEHESWAVVKARGIVGQIAGELANWGTSKDPLFHVTWQCACGEIHDTDVEPNEQGPGLWFCEGGVSDTPILVSW